MFSSSHPGLEAVPLKPLTSAPHASIFSFLLGIAPSSSDSDCPRQDRPAPQTLWLLFPLSVGRAPASSRVPARWLCRPPSSTGVRIHFLTHGSSQHSRSETLDLLVDHVQVSWEADEGLLAQPHLPLALFLSPSLPFLSVCLCLSLSVPLSPAGPCASCSFLASPPLSC